MPIVCDFLNLQLLQLLGFANHIDRFVPIFASRNTKQIDLLLCLFHSEIEPSTNYLQKFSFKRKTELQFKSLTLSAHSNNRAKRNISKYGNNFCGSHNSLSPSLTASYSKVSLNCNSMAIVTLFACKDEKRKKKCKVFQIVEERGINE